MKTFLAILLLSAASLAYGQGFEAAISGGESHLSNGDIGSGYSLTNGFHLGFTMTLNPYRYMGFDFGYNYNRSHLHFNGQDAGGMAIHQGFGDVLLYGTREGSRVRPFVASGVNFSNFVPPGASAQYGQGQNKFGINYGAGLKVKVTGMWQVRFDVRQFNTGKPFGLPGVNGRLLQTEISAGVGVAL